MRRLSPLSMSSLVLALLANLGQTQASTPRIYYGVSGGNTEEQGIYRVDVGCENTVQLIANDTHGMNPRGIALDLVAKKMYWTDVDADRMSRANLDGTGIEILVSSGVNNPASIALDLAAGKMYWTDPFDMDISRANLDGTSAEVLLSVTQGTDRVQRPEGISLDLAAGKMYWSDFTNIRRSNLTGSNVEVLVQTSPEEVFHQGFALDLTNRKMYWSIPNGNIIRRANLDGSDVEDLHAVKARSIALDVANGKMYWITGGDVQRSNLDGTGSETVAGIGSGQGRSLAHMPFLSDINSDCFVDFQDLTLLLANWDKQIAADAGNLVNADTTPVNFADLTVLLADWTGPGPAGAPEAVLGEAVPEPSTLLLALLATLGLSFYRRHRRRAF